MIGSRGTLFDMMMARLVEGIVDGSKDTLDPKWQLDPVGWAERYMGLDPKTLRWSANEGYDDHSWDGTVDPLATVLEALARGKNVGVESGTGTGKAQPVDEPVLTPSGWKTMGDLRPGDRVIGRNGMASKVLEVYPQGTKPIYAVQCSDGATARCCGEHLWTVRRAFDAPWETLDTKTLHAMQYENVELPLVAPVQHPEIQYTADPYLVANLATTLDESPPELYLFGSVEQRLALLQGMMDALGDVDTKLGTFFETQFQDLARYVQQVVWSLGGTALLDIGKWGQYRIHVVLPRSFCPFRDERRASEYNRLAWPNPIRLIYTVEPVGEAECVCILVDNDDHLYVTTDYMVTHNTFLGAVVCMWFVSCFKNALVVTTAPKEAQLLLHLWKELQRNWPKFQGVFPNATLTKLLLKMNPPNMDWIVTGFACGVGADEQSATKAQGFHAEHMLIITEETPGIHQAVMTAFENTCTGDHNLRLAFGNPDHEEDALHKFCTKGNVVHVRISSLDHPNVVTGKTLIPGAVSKRNIEERREEYGEDSPIYRSRVRGICPTEASTALIKRVWCRAAVENYAKEDFRKGLAALGVDVANSPKGDQGAIARGIGAVCLEVEAFPCPDANKLGFRVALEMGAHSVDEQNVGVDGIGVGAGTVNELSRLRYSVRALLGSAAAIQVEGQTEQFGNLRAQMHWKARQDLQHGKIGLPDDEELILDLTTPLWFIRNGKIWVESKEEIKKRLGRSPNKGDAFIYWNWVREPIQGGATLGGRIITLS